MANYLLQSITIPNSSTGDKDTYHNYSEGVYHTTKNGEDVSVKDMLDYLESEIEEIKAELTALKAKE